ncbi:MAG: hydrolase, partial [Frankiales bacterium]|nr:hydrolase [Frankiales bacterium]
AARLGVPVLADDRCGELRWEADPSAVVETVLGLGSGTRTTVVCSQGGPVQETVGALTAQAGIALDRVRARKGSLWALSFSRGRLVDADYTSDLRPGS